MTGRVHSLESFGSVDGPGIRFVVFLQGCPLRCAYCHNPDAWAMNAGTEMEAEELFRKIRRYKTYFGETGGVTVSGGEALMQPEFVTELFRLCHADGINTCLDTSGCVLDEWVMALLDETDTVLLDIKMITEEDYREYTGGSLRQTMDFLRELHRRKIPTWIRQVIVRASTIPRRMSPGSTSSSLPMTTSPGWNCCLSTPCAVRSMKSWESSSGSEPTRIPGRQQWSGCRSW